jgi:hypothetical protein
MPSICSNFCHLKLNYTVHPNRKKFNPDNFTDDIKQLRNADNRDEFFFFIAHYVRKVFSDNKIVQQLRNTPGSSFLDLITTSDIAYVLTIVKNGRGMWDERMERKEADPEDGMYMHVANVVFY